MQINSICKKKNNSFRAFFWLFLDEDRIHDYKDFLKNIPSSKSVGVIIRTKNKKNLYKKCKMISKLCKQKGFKFFVSANSLIALSVGADGVHFPKQNRFNRTYKKLSYSCSFHSLLDLRRVSDLGVNNVFISPIFKTTSSNLKKPLGLIRTFMLYRALKCDLGVLGGVSKKNIRKFRNRGVSNIGAVNLFSDN
tara:strand:- start:398 stop:976 length:579 start_codon:yes stop_codon:yes gene_type:complete